jgi:hypothetical protein
MKHLPTIRTIAFAIGVFGFAATAGAQGDPATPPGDKCRVEQPSSGAESADAQQPGQEQSLTETLDDCNGVLKPPVVGDGEMTEPPPDAGKTPVIRPNEPPPQHDSE